MNFRVVIGILLTVIALTLYGVGKPKLSKEQTYLEEALENKDGKVFLEGRVSSQNDTLQHFFVLASKEEFTGAGKHRGFKPVEQKLQTLKLQTSSGIQHLIFEEAPYRGEEIAHVLLEETTSSNAPIQWQGVKQHARLLVLGEQEGDLIQVKYSYAGEKENYFQLLEEGVKLLTQICMGLGILGIPLLIWGLVRK
ncbi:hypothetical protein [Flammeovirga sp. SJP92]|uniref:hypothetical protein n=1 Tax=Flammeovirga sp. SJP92 TaxID=1775430 RepID=UPI0007897A0B|nr:hypothetical protein [Flammeovirga sp. SJP92]KXX70321.1 hypothetical protein AVL50_11995 [Flammeovirga sp. SJP92]